MKPATIPRQESLLSRVRAGLALQNTTLAAVCKKHGIDNSHVYKYLNGKINSPTALSAKKLIIEEANLSRIKSKRSERAVK